MKACPCIILSSVKVAVKELLTLLTTFSLGGAIYYANTPMQYTAIFQGCKNVQFQMKFSNIFLIFAQNINCGYTLEPPQ